MAKRKFEFDEIGYWSELKLEIVRKYAAAYSTILAKQKGFSHYYIDGFAGAGIHVSKASGELVVGSPLNALAVQPSFRHYFLIDLRGDRVELLHRLVGDRSDVTFLVETRIVPTREGLSAGSLRETAAGGMSLGSVWPSARLEGRGGSRGHEDNRLVFELPDHGHQPQRAVDRAAESQPEDGGAPDRFWGDESWKDVAYAPSRQSNLFGETDVEKASNTAIVEAFRERLSDIGGFRNVPAPLPMRNSRNAVVYYLFFASQNDAAARIATGIFRRYSSRVGR